MPSGAAAALADRGRQQFRAKRTAQAREAFDQALAADAADGEEHALEPAALESVHSMRGDCHAILGNHAEAAADFSRSIELAPPGAGAIYRYKRGVARLKLGEAEGGEADLRTAVEMGCGLAKKELRRCQQAQAVAKSPPQRPERPGKPRRAERRAEPIVAEAATQSEPDPQLEGGAEAEELVRHQLAIVEREQERLAKLTARVVGAAVGDGVKERAARRAAEHAVIAEQRKAEHLQARAQRERSKAKSSRRVAKGAQIVAAAAQEEAQSLRVEVAEQAERVQRYMLRAQAEIAATEDQAAAATAEALIEGERRRDALQEALHEAAARQRAAATAALSEARQERAAEAEAKRQAESRLRAAEKELAEARTAAAAAASQRASAQPAVCVICLDSPKEVMLEPCHHVCLCVLCAARGVRSCPICRAPVRKTVRLYL